MSFEANVSADMRVATLDWRQVFQAVPDGLIVIERNFDVVYVNRAFAELSGVSEMQAVGRKCYEIFPGTLCSGPACPMSRIQNGVERLTYEADKHCMCGRLIPSIVTASPYRLADGTDVQTDSEVTNEEIGETLLATRFALATTTFATAVEGMEYLASRWRPSALTSSASDFCFRFSLLAAQNDRSWTPTKGTRYCRSGGAERHTPVFMKGDLTCGEGMPVSCAKSILTSSLPPWWQVF